MRLALVLLALAAPAAAQDARLVGTYVLNRGASDDVVGMGLRASGLPAAMRVMARTARGRAMVDRIAPPTLGFSQMADGRVTLRGTTSRTFTPGGPAVNVPSDDGRATLPMRAGWDGPRLVVSWETASGRSSDTYSLDAQGRLTVLRDLAVTVKRDGQTRRVPMRFRLVYDKR